MSLQLCPTLCDPMVIACQAPLSMGFSRQEYWGRLPFPPPGNLPDPGIKPASLAPPAMAGGFFTTAPPENPNPVIRVLELSVPPPLTFREGRGTGS